MNFEMLDKDIRLFRNLICRKSGIYLEGSSLDAFQAQLYTIMESRGFATPDQYYGLLISQPEGQKELEKLLSHITVNETYFFRNKGHFDALRKHVLANLINKNKESSIKIWSAACSTGEETYSIAMTALDLICDHKDLRIEILGTDVDKEAIARAKSGIYGERSLRVTGTEYRNRYFNMDNGKFRIAERLTDLVRFERFNLMETTYPKPSRGNWDVIFCRNVVIYFNRESICHVIDGFDGVLTDDGYLFMGHSETLDAVSDKFLPVEICGAFVYSRKTHSASAARSGTNLSEPGFHSNRPVEKKPAKINVSVKQSETSRLRSGRLEKSAPAEPAKDTKLLYREAVELFAREEVDVALIRIESYMKLRPEDASGHLLAGKIHADRGIYERAVSEFETSIELEPLLAEAHYLLGIIYQALGKTADAINAFKTVAYIDKDCIMPYFNLACTYRSNNMENDALREFNNAMRMMEKLQDDEIMPFSGGLTARLLTQICQKNIEELSG